MKQPKAMKLSKIFLKAAKLIDNEKEDYCCLAISDVAPSVRFLDGYMMFEEETANNLFAGLYKPKQKPYKNEYNEYSDKIFNENNYWWGNRWESKHREQRVLALLFAAAMAESVGE